MSKNNWQFPARPEPVESRHSGKRKNTKINCGGHQGRAHKPRFELDQRKTAWLHTTECHSVNNWLWERYREKDGRWHFRRIGSKIVWRCLHVVVCERCGKIMDHFPACPTNPDNIPEVYPQDRKVWDL